MINRQMRAFRPQILAGRRAQTLPAHLFTCLQNLLLPGLPIAVLLPALFAGNGTFPVGRSNSPGAALTSIAQLHHLSFAAVAAHPAAVIEGVVTGLFFMPNGFMLQDNSDGIYISFRGAATDVRIGQRLRVRGTADPGGFSPVLVADRIDLLGNQALPKPRKINWPQVVGGVLDNQRIEAKGVVRAITAPPRGEQSLGIMKLDMNPGSVLVLASDFGDDPRKYIDSVVRVRGIATFESNKRRQALGLRIRVSDISDITVVRSAPKSGSIPHFVPIQSILRYETALDWSHRIRISGTVTLQRAGEFVVLQDESGPIRVFTSTAEAWPWGTVLDVSGFVSTDGYSPALKDAVILRKGIRKVADPLPQTALQLLGGLSNWSLVRITGTLIESLQSSTGATLIMEEHGKQFSAELKNGGTDNFSLIRGSQIQLTGICEISVNALRQPVDFHILLRSPADITVLKSAPLLMNREFLVLGGESLAVVAIVCTLWALTMRLQVRKQTSWIRARLGTERLAATQDLLTGISNRRNFEASFREALQNAGPGEEVALLYVDLGDFKRINDTMGHSVGDSLLSRIALRLGGVVDSTQLLSRIGGDEFTVLQPVGASLSSSEELARRLLESLEKTFDINGIKVKMTASIGISRYPADGRDIFQLLQSADLAMYHAKRNRRGFYFFDSRMREAMERKAEVGERLPGVLERGEFAVDFQPIFNVSTGALVRFEALCRWNSPQLGIVPPSEFIGISEETDQIKALGRWILRESCLQCVQWQLSGSAPIAVAVNVSAIQFSGEDFLASVQRILTETGLPPHLLELELTESVLLGEPEVSARKMHLLRNMGIELSIDDFGTGYSSLSYLQNLPVDALKIDRSFTDKLDTSPRAVSMIRSVIAMGRTLGLRVVTEGVETEAQFAVIRQLGSDEVQGFFNGRPAPAESTLALVITHSQKAKLAVAARIASAVHASALSHP